MTIGSRAQVYHGNADRTAGGLTKKDLKMKDGEIVSKSKSKDEKKNPWIKAVAKAKKELGVKKGGGFEDHIPKKGSELYKLAKEIYSK
jgi:hypothetical protein